VNFEECFKRCIDALNESKGDYIIVGGVLVSIYGEPRATKDVDVLIKIDSRDLELTNNFLVEMRKNDIDIK